MERLKVLMAVAELSYRQSLQLGIVILTMKHKAVESHNIID